MPAEKELGDLAGRRSQEEEEARRRPRRKARKKGKKARRRVQKGTPVINDVKPEAHPDSTTERSPLENARPFGGMIDPAFSPDLKGPCAVGQLRREFAPPRAADVHVREEASSIPGDLFAELHFNGLPRSVDPSSKSLSQAM